MTTTTARTRDAATARKDEPITDSDNPDFGKTEQPKASLPTTTQAASVPAFLADRVKQDAGQGISTDAADNIIPLIYVLQGLSPQAQPRNAAYIEGAAAGDFWLRNASRPIISGVDGLLVQPVHFYKEIVEWVPRDQGGGFVARHDWNAKHPNGMPADAKEVKDPENPRRVSWVSPRGTEYIETRAHVVIVYTQDGPLGYVIPFTSTGHTVSRQWMFMMGAKKVGGETAPSYACLYRLTTEQKKNKDGEWFQVKVQDGGSEPGPAWVDEKQYMAGKALHEAFVSGAKQAEAPAQADTAPSGGGEPDDGGGRV